MTKIVSKEIMGKNIEYYMKLNNKTRYDVCNDCGFNYPTFSNWINGYKYPRIDKIEILANYFGIEKSDLIEEKKERKGAVIIADPQKVEINKKWVEEFKDITWTDDEIEEMFNFARYLISKRK